MKLVQMAIFVSMFICIRANAENQNLAERAYTPPQPRERRSGPRHGHQSPRIISEQDVTDALNKLQQEPYSPQKLSAVRQLMMRSRHTNVSEQTQEKVHKTLQELSSKYNKEDRRESLILGNLLSMAQTSPLLSASQKDDIKTLASNIPTDVANPQSQQVSSNFNDLYKIKAKDNYKEKMSSLMQVMRRSRMVSANKYAQSEVSAAIHDLYDQRPMDNVGVLSQLQAALHQAQTSPLLSTIKQYEVKEIMLPHVTKNLESARTLAATEGKKAEADTQTA